MTANFVVIKRRMKKTPKKFPFLFSVFATVSVLSACGQPGPLYLPTDKPPIYVAPTESTQQETESKPEQEKATTSPPKPESNQPTKEQ